MKYYDWQKEIINAEGDVTIRGGRQSGKSWAVAEQIKHRAHKYPGSRHLIIAPAERQENYLLAKFKALMGEHYKYKGRATMTHLILQNGSEIYKFPVGTTGVFVEGLSSIDFIYPDEAIHMGDKVWDSILPMMAEPKKRGLGWITLLSATKGKPKGFFYKSFSMKHFTKFHIKTADCAHISQEFMEQERERLGERMFRVVYEGEFDEFAYLYFGREIVERAATFKFWSFKKDYDKNKQYYLGIDPARFGKSEAGFVISEITGKTGKLVHYEAIKMTSLPDLVNKTQYYHGLFKFNKIYIDDGGFGAGLLDILQEEFGINKVIGLNNAASGLEHKALKEDLYSNMLRLLQSRRVEIVNEKKLIDDLAKVSFGEDGKIIGTDLSEAATRALWPLKKKHLRSFVIPF